MRMLERSAGLVPRVRTLRAALAATLAAALLMLAACAQGRPAKESMPAASGFLGDVSTLRPSPDHPDRWYTLSRRLTAYDTFIVEKPVMRAHATTRGEPIDAAKADELCTALQEALMQALSGQYTLGQTPGPRVARIRTAITQIASTMSGGQVHTGGGTREMEVVDSLSGARLAAVIETDFGRDEHAAHPDAPYHDSRAVFTHWSARLALMLRDAARLATTD